MIIRTFGDAFLQYFPTYLSPFSSNDAVEEKSFFRLSQQLLVILFALSNCQLLLAFHNLWANIMTNVSHEEAFDCLAQ